MDKNFEKRLRMCRPPFHGVTIHVEEMLPVFLLRRTLNAIVGVLHDHWHRSKIFTMQDWRDHDGVMLPARRSSWDELLAILASDDALYESMAGDTLVKVAFFPKEREFLLRYYIPEPQELEDSSLTYGTNFYIPVPHEQALDNRWGRLDLTISPALQDVVLDACRTSGCPEPRSTQAKSYFLYLHKGVYDLNPDARLSELMEREFSPRTNRLVQSIYEEGGFWYKPEVRLPFLTSALQEIGKAGECAAVTFILPFVFSDIRTVAEATAEAIGNLLRLHSSRVFLRCVSPASCMEDPAAVNSTFRNLNPDRLAYFESFGQDAVYLLGVASLHCSGYVRERAVERLRTVRDGRELAFLLVRMNDWVRRITDLAKTAVESRITPEYAGHFVKTLGLIHQLKRSQRANYSALADMVMDVLRLPESRLSVLSGMESEDVEVKRSCFRIMFGISDASRQELVMQAAGADDTLLKKLATYAMADAYRTVTSPDDLLALAKSRFAPLRREALRLLLEKFPQSAETPLRGAIFDPNEFIRQFAQRWLKEEAVSIADVYREALHSSQGVRLRTAIEGLGETGSPEDVALLTPFSGHPVAKTRVSTIRALANLDKAGSNLILMRLLADNSLNVSGAARRALAAKPYVVELEQLWDIFQHSTEPHVRANALSLIARYPMWDRIPYLIRASCDPDDTVRKDALLLVRKWIACSSFLNPSRQQIADIRQAIAECEKQLPPTIVEGINFAIRNL